MPSSGVDRDSRGRAKSGASAGEAPRSAERRDKAKGGQGHAAAGSHAAAAGPRRGSALPGLGSVAERPPVIPRTYSAPLVDACWFTEGQRGIEGGNVSDLTAAEANAFAQAGVGVLDEEPDDEEVAGVAGAVRHFQPFHSPQLQVSEAFPEINIAVIGAEGVGKSTFVQKALDLPHLPPSQAAERAIPVDGSFYTVRLLELSIDDVDIDDDDTVEWPDTIENRAMPKVDGALTLYNVKDKGSLENVPEMLNAINKASLPSVLVSCKCDTPAGERELDPSAIEQKARRSISNLSTTQTSDASLESHKRAVAMLLKAIVLGNSRTAHRTAGNDLTDDLTSPANDRERSASAQRRRAQSTAVRPVSPVQPGLRGHSRARSEQTGGLLKDEKHTRHDSSIVGYASHDRLKVPHESMHSFLLEESASEESHSARSSTSVDGLPPGLGGSPSLPTPTESGCTFDELVDRLLAPPKSKADNKFAAIFLALYRKFAAPGRLLEVIVERFEQLDKNGGAQMIKTVSQLRYLAIIEQWIGTYPGDFAYFKTKRRMRTFVTKLSQSRIFAVSAKEMASHLDMAQDDDDTNWAYTDKDREDHADHRTSSSSTSSTLIDDPTFVFAEDVSGKIVGDDKAMTPAKGRSEERSASGSSTTSSQIIVNVEAAQKQAQSLECNPRQAIGKVQWRLLMDQPDDSIARELTRMDWIMFSSVRPRDMVRQVSLPAAEKTSCKNLVHVNRMIEHFNRLATWASNFILFRDKPKHRALMLEKLMRVARKLRELNNYNALGAIIAGVGSTATHRLAATRELIPPAAGKDWLKLEILMASTRSHAAYRLAWENSSGERIPYLPLLRRDLAAAEEGNRTFVGPEPDGRINWRKFEVMGEVVVGMQRAQGMPYPNLGVPHGDAPIKSLVLDVKLESDEEVLYEMSLQREPAAPSAGATQKFREFFKR